MAVRLGNWFGVKDIEKYPKIYTKAIDINNSELYPLQVKRFFEPLAQRGIDGVNESAYIEKHPFATGEMYQFVSDSFMKHHKIMPLARAQCQDYDVVFVWDIKDITMLSIDHILELSMLRPDIGATSLFMLQKLITDKVQGANEIKGKVDNIRDVRGIYQMLNAVDELTELYESVKPNGSNEKESIIPHDLLDKLGILEHKEELCQIAEKHQEVYHQRCKVAKKCMKLVNIRSAKSLSRKFANVVLCNQGVVSGIAQILAAGLSSEVDVENVFSTYRSPNEPNMWKRMNSVVGRLQQRFGENCLFIHVTSGPSYAKIPMQNWPIRSNEAFDYLYNFQRDFLQ